uniref:Distal antenna-young, isoform A n=2 Tax=Drosophila melanogaster TaxID=7227 RepID=Q9W2B0_DROME|eukprot:NP_726137.2 distal antenna-young, isoform C [Drosophila melanogaster]
MERFGIPRGKRPRVQVSLDDKERAIARIRGGETKAGISRELGVPESTVRGWVKRAEQRLARETTSQTGSANYSTILAMTLAKPQVTISTKSSASSVISKSSYSSPPLDLKPLKQPQKRNINGHPVTCTQDPVEDSAATSIPIPVPIPVPLPVPPMVSPDSEQQMSAWLHIFNAGILNFTLIASAAVLQARSRGLADRLPLWQIITDFVDEAERNVNANGGWYLEGQPATGHMSARQRPVRVPTKVHSYRRNLKAPPAHITAEDDEDSYTDADVPH